LGNVLSSIALVPSTPLLVPELGAAAAAETAELRDAALTAVATLPGRWVAVGVADDDAVFGPDTAGTFAGYGVDVPVRLSAGHDGSAVAPSPLPLCALVAGWLRGAAQPQATVQVRTHRSDLPVAEALTAGRQLRAELADEATPTGVLVIADGANTLTPPAPGGHDPASVPVQAALDDALAAGDTATLARADGPAAVAVGRVAYQVLAGLTDPAPRSAKELHRSAPYGVGYFVGLWTP
jgi:hypothetical protein